MISNKTPPEQIRASIRSEAERRRAAERNSTSGRSASAAFDVAKVAPAPVLSQADEDRYQREFWHPTPKLVQSDEFGEVYELNKNWVRDFTEVQEDFAQLLQLFYDYMPVVRSGRMSTTGLEVLTSLVVKTSPNRITYLDRDVLMFYRGRQFLVHNKQYSPGDKANDARSMLAKVRMRTPYYRDRSSATQIDALAHAMKAALRKPDAKAQAEALARLPDRIKIDTRSALGRPSFLNALPVNPPQDSTAYIEKRFNDWTLRIVPPKTDADQVEEASTGHPPSSSVRPGASGGSD